MYLQKQLGYIHPGNYIQMRRRQRDSTETATIHFTVDSTGKITNVRCPDPNGMTPVLLRKAMEIIEGGPRWIPATIGGQPVAQDQRQQVIFVAHN